MTLVRSLRLSGLFLSGILVLLPGLSRASQTAPVDLHSLVITTGTPDVHVPIPRSKAFSESRKMVFRFLGTPKFFVGVIVQSFDGKGRLLHHGLFDQGPVDEVLSKALFHKEERIQILGVFQKGNRRFFRIRRFSTGKTLSLPLDRALTLLTAHIGSRPDLVWAVR